MIEYEQALERILAAVPALKTECVPIAAAHDRFLSDAAVSLVALPPFDNSAMDGYAVRAESLRFATPQSPIRLRLAGRVAAGSNFSGEVGPESCVRVFTGSPIPAGADAVVMQEDTHIDSALPGHVDFLTRVALGENLRRCGSDVPIGTMLSPKGCRLTSHRVSLLSAAGLAKVNVGSRPAVGILATGSELVEAPTELQPGQIYESNRAGLAALARRAGGEPKIMPLVRDDLAATRSALSDALGSCDFLVTSGGVSVGETDYVKPAFEALGGAVEFWRVAIKPGKPFVFGRLGGKLLFGLPGNPVSALVTFVLLVRPALLRWQGAAETDLPTAVGVLAERLVNEGSRRHFMRVCAQGRRVFSAGLQASHALGSLAAATGLVDVPPETVLEPGAAVTVMLWD